MASLPALTDGIALTHFIVAEDVERAGRFYSDVLGDEIVLAGDDYRRVFLVTRARKIALSAKTVALRSSSLSADDLSNARAFD